MNECILQLRPFVDPANDVQLHDPLYRVKVQEENPEFRLNNLENESDYPVKRPVENPVESRDDESDFQVEIIRSDQPVKIDLEPEFRQQQNRNRFVPAIRFHPEIRCNIESESSGKPEMPKPFLKDDGKSKNVSSNHFRRHNRVQPLYFGPKMSGNDFKENENKNRKNKKSSSSVGCCNFFAKSLRLTFGGENLTKCKVYFSIYAFS